MTKFFAKYLKYLQANLTNISGVATWQLCLI